MEAIGKQRLASTLLLTNLSPNLTAAHIEEIASAYGAVARVEGPYESADAGGGREHEGEHGREARPSEEGGREEIDERREPRDGNPLKWALMEMGTVADAEVTADHLNGGEIDGLKITCAQLTDSSTFAPPNLNSRLSALLS